MKNDTLFNEVIETFNNGKDVFNFTKSYGPGNGLQGTLDMAALQAVAAELDLNITLQRKSFIEFVNGEMNPSSSVDTEITLWRNAA